jgi:branched-chain amino acid aminotransferase
MEVDQLETSIQLTKNSRLSQVNWKELPFGKTFSDHMFCMTYANGEWSELQIKPYDNLSLSPATSGIHYGQSCFEGMKAHRKINGDIALFRPFENAKRFNSSAERMCMPTVPEELFVNALKKLIDLDKDWVPENPDHSLYIRPFMFATDPFIGIRPSENYQFIIFTCPVGAYYSEPVPVKIETSYTRAVDGGTGYAKVAGNYAAALYPAKLAAEEGFKQLIWTDAKEHKYIEEAGTMNVLFVIGDTLITPKSSETILSGITRRSVVDIAKDWGMKVEERKVEVLEIVNALKNGTLKEAFGAGTAATIAPIASISFNGHNFQVPESNSEHFHVKVMDYLNAYKTGKSSDKFNWLITV